VATETDPATSPLQVRVRREGTAAVIVLVGEFDLASLDIARAGLEEALDAEPTQVTIDLRGLSFIDSSAISFLLTAARSDGNVSLQFLPSDAPAVRRILQITGVDGVLGVDGTSGVGRD
jgi:anti-sigma B factor antagonist